MKYDKPLILPNLSEEEIEKFKEVWEKALYSGEPQKITIEEEE